jgi:hypothetical protein
MRRSRSWLALGRRSCSDQTHGVGRANRVRGKGRGREAELQRVVPAQAAEALDGGRDRSRWFRVSMITENSGGEAHGSASSVT